MEPNELDLMLAYENTRGDLESSQFLSLKSYIQKKYFNDCEDKLHEKTELIKYFHRSLETNHFDIVELYKLLKE